MSINTTARYLALHYDMHAFQLVFFYNILGLMFFLPFARKHCKDFKTNRKELYWLRAVLEFAAFSLVFAALAFLPLPVHTALSFTSPLFGSIAAILILKEPNSIHRWVALVVGFLGVIMIAGSESDTGEGIMHVFDHINPYTWYMIGSALLFALCGVCIKKLTQTEPSARIAFYMMFMTTIVSAPFAIWQWQHVASGAWPFLLLIGVLVAGVQYAVSQAYSKGDMTLILPFFFVNLLWSALFGWLFFSEMLRPHTVYGAVVILGASFYAAYMAKREEQLQNKVLSSATSAENKETATQQ